MELNVGGNDLNGFKKWIIGGIAASFLLSVGVSVSVAVFLTSHVEHPVGASEFETLQEDVREIRADVKTILRRDT